MANRLRREAGATLGHLTDALETGGEDQYFQALRDLFSGEIDNSTRPRLFGAYAAEIKRQFDVTSGDQQTDTPGSLLAETPTFEDVRTVQQNLYGILISLIPDPSAEFQEAVGEDFARRAIGIGIVNGIRRGVGTMTHQGLRALPVVSELMRAHDYSDDQRTAVLGKAGLTFIRRPLRSQREFDRLEEGWEVFYQMNLPRSSERPPGALGPHHLTWAVYAGRENIASDFLFNREVIPDGQGSLRWRDAPHVNIGCPMTFVMDTVTAPTWNVVMNYALDNGFTP